MLTRLTEAILITSLAVAAIVTAAAKLAPLVTTFTVAIEQALR